MPNQALRELEGENGLFKRALNHLPQMVWWTLPDGYHDFYNDAWYDFTGVPRGSTDGELWNGMFHPDDQERAWVRWRHSLRTGEPYEIEYRLRHRDGDYRWTLGRALPERNQNGEIVRWYGTCTDIHQQYLAQEKIKSLQGKLVHAARTSAMASMATTLAHEVNQPLATAVNFAASLRAYLGADTRHELLEGIAGVENAMLRAGEIIRHLRNLTTEKPRAEHVPIAPFVLETQELLADEPWAVPLEFDLDEQATAYCDPFQIQQVLAILVRRSCKSLKGNKAPRVLISTVVHQELIRFSVEDNGPGLPSGGGDAIFDALRFSESGMDTELAVCRTIVEAHGGTLRASDRLPRGTRFFFELPVNRAAD